MTTSTNSLSPADSNSGKLLRALPYYAAYLIMGLSLSVIGPTLLSLAEQTGSSLSEISIIIAGNSLGVVLGSLLGGRLYDRWRGHPVFAIAAAILGGVLLTIPLIPSRWVMVMMMVLLGAGVGVMDVGGNTLIVWLFGKAVGPFMNALHLSFGVGALLAPLLADRVVVATGEINWVYWILAGLTVPVLVWLTRISSPGRPALQKEEEANGQSIRQYSLLIVMLAALFFLHTGTELGFGNWIFSYAVAIKIGPDTVARLLNSVYWGGFTLGRVIAIPLALKMKPKTMLLLDLIGAVASVTLMLLLPGWPPGVWIGTFGLGLSIASMFPTCLNFAERRMPITGRVTSYLLIGANAGAMVLPWVVGQLFEPVGPQSLIIVLEVAVVLALALFLGITRYSRQFKDE
ncbi:MAG: MFS transporter [Anaerolineales bacterium]|nr:MFS transporter [Anaerolineales bacterium]